MRRLIGLLVSAAFLVGFQAAAQASDWDVAGKILTGIEGMRILTGGRVDIIGTITGIEPDQKHQVVYSKPYRYKRNRHNSSRRIWVPDYVWKKKWVPKHTEYDPELGEIIVGGHYLRYKIETGGHWGYSSKRKQHSRRH